MVGRQTVLGLELILIACFGLAEIAVAALLEQRVRAPSPTDGPSLDELERAYAIPSTQRLVAATEQDLTALRAQVIASDIDVRRARAKLRALAARYPVLARAPGPPGGDPTSALPAEIAKAFDDAVVAEAAGALLARDLAGQIERREDARLVGATTLLQAQRAVALRLAELTRARESDADWTFAEYAIAALVAFTVTAGWLAARRVTRERRRFAVVTVSGGVACLGITALAYCVTPHLGLAAGAVLCLLALLAAARVRQ